MLSPKHRIRSQEDFRQVLKKGFLVSSGRLKVRVLLKGSNQASSRAGFLVGKKTAAKAVIRNNIKRMLRFLAAEIIGKFPVGVDLVFMLSGPVLKKANKKSLSDFARERERLRNKLLITVKNQKK